MKEIKPKHRQGRRRSEKELVCPHSDSCFTCPLPDCVADEPYNEILTENLYLSLMEPDEGELT